MTLGDLNGFIVHLIAVFVELGANASRNDCFPTRKEEGRALPGGGADMVRLGVCIFSIQRGCKSVYLRRGGRNKQGGYRVARSTCPFIIWNALFGFGAFCRQRPTENIGW